jgi:hypothetical protein
MKVGDDMGKPYRKQMIDFDPIEEKSRRFSNRALLAVVLYLSAHVIYALYN